mmetsp:Transcript_7501/g.20478  ORF Transcript_7501/g.20478 Transcript_7501/m.20478 type:complete len:350 (+) Transcript_7501:499-1548(+)
MAWKPPPDPAGRRGEAGAERLLFTCPLERTRRAEPWKEAMAGGCACRGCRGGVGLRPGAPSEVMAVSPASPSAAAAAAAAALPPPRMKRSMFSPRAFMPGRPPRGPRMCGMRERAPLPPEARPAAAGMGGRCGPCDEAWIGCAGCSAGAIVPASAPAPLPPLGSGVWSPSPPRMGPALDHAAPALVAPAPPVCVLLAAHGRWPAEGASAPPGPVAPPPVKHAPPARPAAAPTPAPLLGSAPTSRCALASPLAQSPAPPAGEGTADGPSPPPTSEASTAATAAPLIASGGWRWLRISCASGGRGTLCSLSCWMSTSMAESRRASCCTMASSRCSRMRSCSLSCMASSSII